MGYTVARPAGCTDWDMHEYLVRLNQRGVTLGRAPRVRDPLTGQRWLYHWDDRDAAERHAALMRKYFKDSTWRVIEVPGPTDVGPLWPLVFHVVIKGLEVEIMADSLTERILSTIHPEAVRPATSVAIGTAAWQTYKTAKGGFDRWARDVMPILTGVTLAQIDSIGYALVNAVTFETMVASESQTPAALAGVS
jgi:hypothetical protein